MLVESILGGVGYLFYKSQTFTPEYHNKYITQLPPLIVKNPEIIFLLFLFPLLYQIFKYLFQEGRNHEDYHGREFPKYFPKLEGFLIFIFKTKVTQNHIQMGGTKFVIHKIYNLVESNMLKLLVKDWLFSEQNKAMLPSWTRKN
jgi:hypothetical protein